MQMHELTHPIAAQLLQYVQHGRISCSDDNPSNAYPNEQGYPRCTRCFLLGFANNVLEYQYVGFSIEIAVRVGHEVNEPKWKVE